MPDEKPSIAEQNGAAPEELRAFADGQAEGRALAGAETTAGLPPAAVELPRMVRALRHRDFRLFWFGNFLSNTGTWMQNIAQGWLVLQLTDSPFWLGVVGFAASAPLLVFTMLGGVIADHVDRRRMMFVTQTAMMVFAFALAGLSYAGIINVAEIALLAFLTGIAMALNTPSYQALVPQLVPRDDLTNAIALNSAQFNLSRVLGPTLGGFFMAWFGVSGNFLLNGLSFLAVILALARIRYPAQEAPDGSATLWQRLAEGLRYLFSNRQMRVLVILVGLASVFGVPYLVFIPYFARDVLHAGERGLGILMAFSGLGSFLGAVVLAWQSRMPRRGRYVFVSGAFFFASIIAFAFSRHFALSSAVLVVAGFAMISMVATVNSLLQHLSAEHMRGRVMSIYATAFLGFAPVGSLLAAALADSVGTSYAIAGMSAVALLGSLYLYFVRPTLRRLE